MTHRRTRSETARPFVKWAGGKGQIADKIVSYFPDDYRRYFEPFLGGGAVFFRLLPRSAILSDSNGELINCYVVVRDDVDDLIALLRTHAMRHSKKYYYETRAEHRLKDPIEKAARTIYLNKTCYNGLYRVNSQGEFNVPFGDYSNPTILDEVNLRHVSEALQDVELKHAPYKEMTKRMRKSDLVYMDPPYHPISSTANFTSYTRDAFSDEDQKALAKDFFRLSERGVCVALSNSDTCFTREIYASYAEEMIEIKAPRYISCKGSGRNPAAELLILSYKRVVSSEKQRRIVEYA